MIVSVCTVEANSLGDVLMDASADSEFAFLTRRVSRIPTLDGGALIIDNGYGVADGKIRLIVSPHNNSPALYERVAAIVKFYGLVTVASAQGVFLAAIESVLNDRTELTINLLVKSQLS